MRGPVRSRAARQFASALDAPTRHSAGRQDAATRELVGLVHRLESLPIDAGPTDEFRDRLRQRLVAVATVQHNAEENTAAEQEPTAASDLVPGFVPRPRQPLTERLAAHRQRGHRRLAFAAGALAALVIVGGLTVAEAGHAVRGDVLYGLKRTTENVQLSLAGSDAAAGREHLSIAATRLTEVRNLIGHSDTAAGSFRYVADGGPLSRRVQDRVVSTLADMDQQTKQGARLVTTSAVHKNDRHQLSGLKHWASKQQSALSDLQGRLTDRAASRAGSSVALLGQVIKRAEQLAAAPCSCPTKSDALGPLPCTTCPPTSGPTSGSPTSTAPSSTSSSAPGSTSSATPSPTTHSKAKSTAPKSTSPSDVPSDTGSASGSASPTPSLPPAPTSSTSPTPTGILPTGILPTTAAPTSGGGGLLPTWLLPSLLPSNLLPIGH